MKFAKYSWGYDENGNEKYAIVQIVDEESEEVKAAKEGVIIDAAVHVNTHWARLVYGSYTGYSKAGRILYFTDMKEITELNPDDVMNEHFVGLI